MLYNQSHIRNMLNAMPNQRSRWGTQHRMSIAFRVGNKTAQSELIRVRQMKCPTVCRNQALLNSIKVIHSPKQFRAVSGYAFRANRRLFGHRNATGTKFPVKFIKFRDANIPKVETTYEFKTHEAGTLDSQLMAGKKKGTASANYTYTLCKVIYSIVFLAPNGAR